MAEDPLQGEHVATVRQERSRKTVAQDVRRAAVGDAGRDRQPPDKLLNGPPRDGSAASPNEQGRVGVHAAANGQPRP